MKKSLGASLSMAFVFLFVLSGPLFASGIFVEVGHSWVRYEWNAGGYDTVYANMINRDDLGDNYHGDAHTALDHNGYGIIGWSNVYTKSCPGLQPTHTCGFSESDSSYDGDDFRTAGKYTTIYNHSGSVVSGTTIYSNLQ